MSPDKNKWRKHALKSKLKTISDMKTPNKMNCIHNNEVNKISGCDLPNDI